MGLLLKIILFGLVFYFIIKTVGGFVFRLLGGTPQQSQQNQQRQAYQRKKEGEINIDYMPKNQKGRSGRSSKDGDYIDYEEVK